MVAPVRLRLVQPADLAVFHRHQLDPEALHLVAFTPRDEAAFMAHWAKIAADPATTVRTIVSESEVAGYISAFPQDGLRKVGYWIGREFWNRGIATRALELFLAEHRLRPLHASVARHNQPSIRVLQKQGFTMAGAARDDRDPDRPVEEYLLKLS